MEQAAFAQQGRRWGPAPAARRARRPGRRPQPPWPGDVTPEAAMTALIPIWIEQRARPPVTLLGMSIGAVLLADLSLLLYLA